MRAFIKQAVRVGLHRLGGLGPVLWWTRQSLRILTYHRFSERFYPGGTEALRRQCAFLKRNFEVLPLSAIGECLRAGKRIPDRALVITIDDGYRDVLVDAHPVFREAGIPATVFLITGFLDRKLWPWWNQVEYAVLHSKKPLIEASLGGEMVRLPLETAEQRALASTAICGKLVTVSNSSRVSFVHTLPELFAIDLPQDAPPEYAPLSWDEVRWLAGSGVEFGAHTQTHPVLPRMEHRDEVSNEILGSKARVDRELGRPTLCFCYPNGDRNDAIEDLVKEAGFEIAVTTQSGLNRRGANPYQLKRFTVEPGLSDHYFREEVTGLRQ
jgi:peptidoglycan/xylan/chitin deacetylase (PgdA/CDA1 family)